MRRDRAIKSPNKGAQTYSGRFYQHHRPESDIAGWKLLHCVKARAAPIKNHKFRLVAPLVRVKLFSSMRNCLLGFRSMWPAIFEGLCSRP